MQFTSSNPTDKDKFNYEVLDTSLRSLFMNLPMQFGSFPTFI